MQVNTVRESADLHSFFSSLGLCKTCGPVQTSVKIAPRAPSWCRSCYWDSFMGVYEEGALGQTQINI